MKNQIPKLTEQQKAVVLGDKADTAFLLKIPGGVCWAGVATNSQRLRRQGEIFNHSGECGKIKL